MMVLMLVLPLQGESSGSVPNRGCWTIYTSWNLDSTTKASQSWFSPRYVPLITKRTCMSTTAASNPWEDDLQTFHAIPLEYVAFVGQIEFVTLENLISRYNHSKSPFTVPPSWLTYQSPVTVSVREDFKQKTKWTLQFLKGKMGQRVWPC